MESWTILRVFGFNGELLFVGLMPLISDFKSSCFRPRGFDFSGVDSSFIFGGGCPFDDGLLLIESILQIIYTFPLCFRH